MSHIADRSRTGAEVNQNERVCDDCGDHNPVWFAPSRVWNLIVGGPEAQGDPGGFICPVCFIERAEAKGHLVAWRLVPEFGPLAELPE